MSLVLPSSMIGQMIAHAYEEAPNECCGMISGKDGIPTKLHHLRNSEASPYRYQIHPLDYRKVDEENEANGWELMAIYHSHVASRAYPSPTDVRMARWPGSSELDMFPDAYYILISLKDHNAPLIRAFKIKGGKVSRQAIIRPSELPQSLT